MFSIIERDINNLEKDDLSAMTHDQLKNAERQVFHLKRDLENTKRWAEAQPLITRCDSLSLKIDVALKEVVKNPTEREQFEEAGKSLIEAMEFLAEKAENLISIAEKNKFDIGDIYETFEDRIEKIRERVEKIYLPML